MKRLRGLLRLVRDPVGHRTYRSENVVLRDTARSLAAARDARVQVETLRLLRQRYADLLDGATFQLTERWLLERHARQCESLSEQALTSAVVTVGAARSRFASFRFEDVIGDTYDSIAPGIGRVYRRGLRGYQRSVESSRPEDFHIWRKRVKYLRYQMEFLTPLQSALIGSTAAELDRLGEDLGREHDLVVLAQTLDTNPDACPDERERWLLLALVFERRAMLHEAARRLGAAVYAESEESFVARVGCYWKAARG